VRRFCSVSMKRVRPTLCADAVARVYRTLPTATLAPSVAAVIFALLGVAGVGAHGFVILARARARACEEALTYRNWISNKLVVITAGPRSRNTCQ
jgi:hypothetical protein